MSESTRTAHSHRLVGALLAAALLPPGSALAHQDPPACSGINTAMGLQVLRADGSGVVGTVSPCETLLYRASLSWSPLNPECLIQDGKFEVVTPDGVSTTIEDPVRCLGEATVDAEGCTVGQDLFIQSGDIPYTVQPGDIVGGMVTGTALWSGGVLHQNAGNVPGQGDMRAVEATVEDCDDDLFCNGVETCDPAASNPETGQTGICVPGTPPNCGVDDGCVARFCDEEQDICDSTDLAGNCGDSDGCIARGCDPASGTDPGVSGCFTNDLSGQCGTDDGCFERGCEDGNGPTEGDVPGVTGCFENDLSGNCDDSNVCTDDSCDPAVGTDPGVSGCVNTDISAECNDNNACTADSCDPVDGCINTDISAQCNDDNACTRDSCDPATGCVNTDITAECNDNNACTADSCDPATGCVNTDTSARCNDEDVCTDDSCDPETGCVNTDNSARCDDSDVCTDDSCHPVDGCMNVEDPTNDPTCSPDTDIEVTKEAECDCQEPEGCTPGYWKQDHHFGNWTGFDPEDGYDATFMVTSSFGGDFTLIEALWQGGGGEIAMGRHAVAALLNSSNLDVNYAFTTAEVKAIVQEAYSSGDFGEAKSLLVAQNEPTHCPLGRAEAYTMTSEGDDDDDDDTVLDVVVCLGAGGRSSSSGSGSGKSGSGSGNSGSGSSYDSGHDYFYRWGDDRSTDSGSGDRSGSGSSSSGGADGRLCTADFKITATNVSDSPATGVVVADVLPDGLIFVMAEATQGTYDPETGDWLVGDLGPGANAMLVISVDVGDDGEDSGDPLLAAYSYGDTSSESSGSSDSSSSDSGSGGGSACIENCAELATVEQTDTNAENDVDCVTIFTGGDDDSSSSRSGSGGHRLSFSWGDHGDSGSGSGDSSGSSGSSDSSDSSESGNLCEPDEGSSESSSGEEECTDSLPDEWWNWFLRAKTYLRDAQDSDSRRYTRRMVRKSKRSLRRATRMTNRFGRRGTIDPECEDRVHSALLDVKAASQSLLAQ